MTRRHWRTVAPLIAMIGVLLLMLRSSVTDPGPTGLPGDLTNLHNWPGDLARNAALVLVAAGVALLILRPWSYHRSWLRALCAAVLFAPWLAFNFLLLIHSGGIMTLHALWLFGLWILFAVATIRSGIAALAAWRSPSEQPPHSLTSR